MDVVTAIQRRRSIRKYKNAELPKELLMQILEVARLAPSGANRQPWQLVVVTDAEKKKALVPICKDQKFVGECSVFIAGIDEPTQKWARVDVAIALEHIALAAMIPAAPLMEWTVSRKRSRSLDVKMAAS